MKKLTILLCILATPAHAIPEQDFPYARTSELSKLEIHQPCNKRHDEIIKYRESLKDTSAYDKGICDIMNAENNNYTTLSQTNSVFYMASIMIYGCDRQGYITIKCGETKP